MGNSVRVRDALQRPMKRKVEFIESKQLVLRICFLLSGFE